MDDESDVRLNELRIQRAASLRRSLYRSRSHAILAAVVCIVAAAELARYAIGFYRQRAILWMIGFILASIISLALAILAARRAMALHRESRRPPDVAPTAEPDFSELSDGSQQWKNLDNIQ